MLPYLTLVTIPMFLLENWPKPKKETDFAPQDKCSLPLVCADIVTLEHTNAYLFIDYIIKYLSLNSHAHIPLFKKNSLCNRWKP